MISLGKDNTMSRTSGQSLVEMALLLPLMIILIFGIIDMGWYVYGYATIYQSARNGAEAAAQLPPFQSTLDNSSKRANDPCYQSILNEITEDAALFPDIASSVEVSYPPVATSGGGGKGGGKAGGGSSTPGTRALGNPIQVKVRYELQPLTPLFQLVPLTPNGVFIVEAKTVRSIENLGNTLITEENPRGISCIE